MLSLVGKETGKESADLSFENLFKSEFIVSFIIIEEDFGLANILFFCPKAYLRSKATLALFFVNFKI